MKKKLWAIFLGSLVAIVIILVGFPVMSFAEVGDFSVKAILPENQLNKEVTYYDLRVQPNQKQEVELKIYNFREEEQTLLLSITDARTTSNGGIDYSKVDSYKKDESLTVGLTEIASVEPSVTVPAKGSVTTKITLQMPPEEFDGIILGGVYVTQKDTKEETNKQSNKMQVKNQVALTLGIKLTETDTPVNAELSYIKTVASQEGGRNLVKATIQNGQATTLEDISYEAKISKWGKDETLHESKVDGYRFAPNSSFDFPISWGNERFESGDYKIVMTAMSKETGQTWRWEEKFKITAAEAKKFNEKAIELEEDNTGLYLLIGGIIGGLLILGIFFVIWRKKKKEKEQEALRKERQKKKRKKKKSDMRIVSSPKKKKREER